MTVQVNAGDSIHIPSGSIFIADGKSVAVSATLDANGEAVSTLSSVAEGSHAITISYSGDDRFAASSSTRTLKVTSREGAIGTITALTVTPTSIPSGDAVTMIAKVTAVSGNVTPSGEVTFSGGVTSALNSSGIATATISESSDTVTAINVTATYSGNDNFRSSFSNTVQMNLLAPVEKIGTTTRLTASMGTVMAPDSVILTAKVIAADSSTPSGIVSFSGGSSSPLNADGLAIITVQVSTLGVGNNSLTATFRGDSPYSTSTSDAVMVMVQQPDFAITGPATLTVTNGQVAIAGFTVTPLNGFSGKVTLECDGKTLTCSLSQSSVDLSKGARNVSASVSNTAATGFLFGFFSIVGILRRKRFPAVALALLMMVWVGGCGSGAAPDLQQSTPPAASQTTLFVHASANGITHAIQVSINTP